MSRTQTITKPAPQASRTYDYLYDPVFTLSSERDHARAMFRSNTSSNRIIRMPEFRQMFSSLQHFPNHSLRLESVDPVPRFIPRQWRGYQEQAREALKRYTKFNYDPSITIPPKHYPKTEVSGRDRYRFFRRPLIPFLQQVPADIVFQTAGVNPLLTTDVDVDRVPTPAIRNAMTQTDYRDSEAQTDPYTPEYVIRPGSQPELLTLATLSYGHGLPAGLAEVEMIERARAKRAWEATLPALDDVENLDKRRKMMDAQERKEWKIREEEIERLQEARLELLQKILQDRENKNAEMNTKRLEKLWLEKEKEKEKKFEKIALEHIKVMRKLALKRKGVEERLERRSILADYTDPGSTTYAPLSRIGVFLDRGSEQYVVRSRYLTTYQGLLELEADLPDCVLKPRIQAPKPRSAAKRGFIKRKHKKQHELDVVAKELEAAKRPEEPLKPLRFLEKIEKPLPRPPTPTVEMPCEEEEERELAVIFLQKVIRGRAIQNMMFEGKEKRFELIQELRSTHALQSAEQAVKKEEKQEILQLQRQRRLEQHKDMLINEALARVEGADLGDMLDFLNKELIRLQEERRIHAFAMLAERQRRMREAEESGRRQVEERRRREEDEIFRQVVKVNRETVDSYLENLILGAIEDTAEEQARQEVREKAEQVNKIAYEMEKSRTRLQSEEIVAELVTSFLLPEVQRIQMRENVKQNQREGLLAAHSVIHEAIENSEREAKAGSSSGSEINEPKTAEEDE